MDWYTWLSKTNLHPTLVYKYGLAFAQNELQEDDLAYFNHDFLQSVGISVAKHRLEILKLARARTNNGFHKLLLVMSQKRKLLTRKLGFHKNPPSDLSPHRDQRSARDDQQDAKAVISGRNIALSGTPDKRGRDKLMLACTNRSMSGPLDVKTRVGYSYWRPITRPNGRGGILRMSPNVSGPTDRLGLSPEVSCYRSEKVGGAPQSQSLWSLMFQDLKPT